MKEDAFQCILSRRISRRLLLQGASLTALSAALPACFSSKQQTDKNLTFQEVPQGLDTVLTVPPTYQSQVLIRWGDPLFTDAPDFDPLHQTVAKQRRQFGYNNDFVGYLPLTSGAGQAQHGLLVVNHEYTSAMTMFAGSPDDTALTRQQVDIDIAAHGMSVVEIMQQDGAWRVLKSSAFNRRITPHTAMQLTGPAAGSERLKTTVSRDGIQTLGTYGNCAGGVTPWGTVLSGEENIDYMFAGNFENAAEKENLERFGMRSSPRKSWAKYYNRWNMEEEPNESLHMGWIVEVDPYNPASVPKKHTALGRFKHEGCNVFINKDQRVVAYSGDDQKFEYLYKFVSTNKYQKNDRAANMRLLSEGILFCAKFIDTGTLQWLPLKYGQGPLTPANGFNSQADVCIDTRKAADLLGATPMDRPEDVEVNPVTGKVYVMLTKNSDRSPSQTDSVNPRAVNRAGQIVELLPPDGDHTSDSFNWEMFLLAGKPDELGTNYHPDTTSNGWLACPDNCTFDDKGNLWIATDGAPSFGIADGLWATATEGSSRGLTKRFLRTPVGAELCGPFFTPDHRTLFCAVQHPGERTPFERPSTRWPDFDSRVPPRPAVIAVTKKDGGQIGN